MRYSGRFLAVVLATGCLEPTSPFGTGEASPACGPADGPAVAIRLGAAQGIEPLTPPIVSILLLDERRETLAVGQWRFGTASSTAGAAYCETSVSCTSATSGMLRLDRVSIPGTLTGEVSLDFPGLGRIRGPFRADWVQRGTICG